MNNKKLFVLLFLIFILCESLAFSLAKKYLLPCYETTNTVFCDDEQTMFVTVTAYSSTPDQTDDSPFTTASGKSVYHGVVAANFLPLGSKIMLPELYGEKVFVVEDRTHKRFSNRVDIWMETREEALQFGVKNVAIKIL